MAAPGTEQILSGFPLWQREPTFNQLAEDDLLTQCRKKLFDPAEWWYD
jgi:hypothetical protein